ncbi:hypothetical protein [uncultured Thiodictyon sp.]|nr:hypothetical protein [uncultured Thiodictyon sp.]
MHLLNLVDAELILLVRRTLKSLSGIQGPLCYRTSRETEKTMA